MVQGEDLMTKLNWDHVRQQQRAQKYGLEIDCTVGADSNKIPKYSDARCSHIMKKILGAVDDTEHLNRRK
jgi:predicted metal-dependent TIM-barrel fold hydrolase